jgi:hypothetical protein
MNKTGWPPGLLQDDDPQLARWLSSRLDARRVVRMVCKEIEDKRKEKAMTQDEYNAAWEDGFRKGYYAGFSASGEGFNSEYPFADNEIDIRTDKKINHHLEVAMKAETK